MDLSGDSWNTVSSCDVTVPMIAYQAKHLRLSTSVKTTCVTFLSNWHHEYKVLVLE